MAKFYKVSRHDPPFPEIIESAKDMGGKSFAECKREIYDHAKHTIQHWKEQIQYFKQLRKEDIK